MKIKLAHLSSEIKIHKNSLFWGFILWLFGYVFGILFFAFVPKDQIGFYILPWGVAMTIWVLLKKISLKSFKDYIVVSGIWTFMAIIFDFLFIVLMFNSDGYYKSDVYMYYVLTFLLPPIVWWYKKHKDIAK